MPSAYRSVRFVHGFPVEQVLSFVGTVAQSHHERDVHGHLQADRSPRPRPRARVRDKCVDAERFVPRSFRFGCAIARTCACWSRTTRRSCAVARVGDPRCGLRRSSTATVRRAPSHRPGRAHQGRRVARVPGSGGSPVALQRCGPAIREHARDHRAHGQSED